MKRKALLIGNLNYSDKNIHRLFAPKEDVWALKAILENSDLIIPYAVSDFLNLSIKKMNKVIKIFFERSTNEELLLFYFSGHGERDSSNNLYLYAKNTKKNNLNDTAFNINIIKDLVKESKAKIKIILLDCCKAGTLPLEVDFLSGEEAIKKGDVSCESMGIAVITATRSIECAYEKKYSFFTECIIKYINAKRGNSSNYNKIKIEELWDYIREKFKQNPLQKPVFKLHSTCEIPIIEYKKSKSDISHTQPVKWPGKILIPVPKGWSGLILNNEYSFLLCYIDLSVNKKIKNERDFWNEYVFKYILNEEDNKTSWKLWVATKYSNDKIFRCPLINDEDAIKQAGKIVTLLLNEKYNNFYFEYDENDVKMKIIITMKNIIYKEGEFQIDVNINTINHLAKKLEYNFLYFWGYGLDYLPKKMKSRLESTISSENDIYSISIKDTKDI